MGEIAIRAEGDIEAPDLEARFLSSLDVSPSTRRTYGRALARFTAWAQEKGIKDPTRETILSYKRDLEEREVSPFTVSAYMVAVRKYFQWLEAERIYPNIAAGIKGAKRARGFRKDPLTVSQVKDLLGGIDRGDLRGKRDYALLNLLIRTGLRTIEVARADVGDISQEGGEAVLWIQGKGREAKDEFVLLTPSTLGPINDYLQERRRPEDTAPLFASLSDRNQGGRLSTRSISRIVKDRLGGVGLDSGRLTAHSLRHTAVTLSLIAGATLQEAQGLARHANISTTMIYAHNIDRISNAAERKIDQLLAREDL